MSQRAAHTFAVVTAAATFLLILVGGLVHATGSSLACPDWPLCHGTALPKMEGGVAVEWGHRLAAGFVACLVLVQAVAFQLSKGLPRRVKAIAWLALVLVLVQAGLGGVTVVLELPTPVSTLHTAISLVFFLAVLWLALRTSSPSTAAPLPDGTVRLALGTTVLAYLQMVLGGLVRHSGAALACTDAQNAAVRSFPLCRGEIWPGAAHPTVLVHVLHRMGGVLVAGFVVATAIAIWRSAGPRRWLRVAAVTLPLLVLGQVVLGVWSVLSFLALIAVELHLGIATLLLGLLAAIVVRGRPAPDDLEAPLRLLSFVRDVIALTKPRITGLVLATFAGGLWLAPVTVPGWRAVMTLVGTVLVVAGANALNMLLERDVDALMDRTRDRPLPQSRLRPEVALAVGVGLTGASMPLLLLGGNALTGLLALFAFTSYVVVYTPMKRTSPAALFVGAIPGAVPPLMGWTTATGRLDVPGLVLFAILFLWQIPHFLAIAIYRADDYARAGLRVLPQVQSPTVTRATIVFFSLALVVVTTLLAPLHLAGGGYLAAAAFLGAVFVVWGFVGFRRFGEAARGWARSLFVVSIVYLTLLFAALVVDRSLA